MADEREKFGMVPASIIERCDGECVRIYAYLDRRTGGENGRPVHGFGYVARELRLAEATVRTHVGHLFDAGVVSVTQSGQKAAELRVTHNPARALFAAGVLLPERRMPVTRTPVVC